MDSCANCKFWRPIDPDFRKRSENGDRYFYLPEDDPQSHLSWGTCQREVEPSPPMFTQDASEYFSALRTLATFSCSAFELRET